MIPKIIHYFWAGDNPMPEKLLACMSSWKKYLPDYEFRFWNEDSFAGIDSVFVKEAADAKYWAYVADYVRIYALYHFGGVYMDTDVMLYRNLDDFLDNKAFIGKESSIHLDGGEQEMYLTTCIMASEAYNPFIGRILAYYDSLHFIQSDMDGLPPVLRYRLVVNSYILSEFAKADGYNPSPLFQEIQRLPSITIYPSHYFDPETTQRATVSRHFAVGSWRGPDYNKPEKITLAYKINWRIRYVFESLAKIFGYKLIKLR